MLDEIYRTIPHREPFLFIDRILEVREDGASAERKIREEEPHFRGHYPGNPLMPGVLLCEAVFQTAAVYMIRHFGGAWEGTGPKTPVLARIQMAKFKRMVRPGDTIHIDTTYKEAMGRFHFMQGKVTVGGKPALTVEFGLALLDSEEA